MRIVHGNIWDTDATAIVIPVNCVGVMGAGLAKQARDRYSGLDAWYKKACREGRITPGGVRWHPFESKIILAATKDHWLHPSRIEWVERICATLPTLGAESLAVPPLGCGLGGLAWEDVLPIMERLFADIDARVYAPR